MPEQVMKPSHSRLWQWSSQRWSARRGCAARLQNCRRRPADHDALGFFHALIPALLAALLLWCLLLLLL